MKATELPELMTIKELKTYLNCSYDTVYSLAKRKDFPSFMIGNKYYINKTELPVWIEKQCKKATYSWSK